MNDRKNASLRGYQSALRAHLENEPSPDADTALALGMRALKSGLNTLELARIHEDAVIGLKLAFSGDQGAESILRAGRFFAKVIQPIEESHRSLQATNVELKDTVLDLNQQANKLAVSNEKLKLEVSRREASEEALTASEMTSSQLLAHSLQMQGQLRELSHRLLTVQEEERKRISRELHDVVSQTLSGISVRLANLSAQTISNAEDFQTKIADTHKLVERSMDIVHRFALDLRPTMLDDLGLVPALKEQLKQFRAESGAHVTVNTIPEVAEFDNALRTVLYRIAQESLSNIARHAAASHVVLNILRSHGNIQMEIKDDGSGFDLEQVSSPRGARIGLLGMKERTEMVGGTFSIDSKLGEGTTVFVSIPVPPPTHSPKDHKPESPIP